MSRIPLFLAVITGMSTLLLSQAAFAGPHNCSRRVGNVNHRQQQQQQRIAQGIRSGELTRREAAQLRMQQAQLRKQERFYRTTGGGLSPAERAKLDQRQDRLNKYIYQQKHDNQDR